MSGKDEQRGGYLGFVAHEVRNPLSTALWSAELLARMSGEDRGGPRGEKLTAMCLRSLGRVRQLVEDHFLCERLDVGGIPVRPEPIGLRDLAEEIVKRRGTEGPPVEVAIDGSTQLTADRMLLDRAIDALISAAGREDTPVRLHVLEEGEDRRSIVVAGAPPPGAAPLEDPRKGSPSDPKGRALALPVARRAAAALGGVLLLEGSAFRLSLPRQEAYTARPDPAAHP